jgi:3-hydroxyisobutyrate dehydrogenase
MKERVGFIGLGTMGRGMARNVLRAGYSLTVHDVMPEPVEALATDGASTATSPREVGERSDVVITMLPEPHHVEAVTLGPDGLYAGLATGAVHIDMSTIDPETTHRCGAEAAQLGIRMLDAPVGKSSAAAAAGELTIMVGGERDLFEECRELLGTMGTTLHYCGPLGSGEVVKLVNNLVSGGILLVVAEAVVLGAKAGVDPQILADVMKGTGAANWQLENTFRNGVFNGSFEPGFKVSLMHKDARLALSMATELGVPAPLSALVKELYATAQSRGLGDLDWGAYTTLVEEVAGVTARYGLKAAAT